MPPLGSFFKYVKPKGCNLHNLFQYGAAEQHPMPSTEVDSLDPDFLSSQVVIHEVVMFHPDRELLQESFPPKNFS